jgi:hypothetical protein
MKDEKDMKHESKEMVAPKVYKMPPSLSVSEDDLPEIRNWKVGNTYQVSVSMKQVSSSLDNMIETGQPGKKITARFHILNIKSDNPKKKEQPIDQGIERLKEKYNKT